MKTRELMIPAARGGTALVTMQRHEYSVTVDVNHRQVLFKIKNRPWTVGHDVDDLALIADAARGALVLTEGKP